MDTADKKPKTLKLEVSLQDSDLCRDCPLFSVSRSRFTSQPRNAFCAVGRKIIKSNVMNKNEVKRPRWCPLKETRGPVSCTGEEDV